MYRSYESPSLTFKHRLIINHVTICWYFYIPSKTIDSEIPSEIRDLSTELKCGITWRMNINNTYVNYLTCSPLDEFGLDRNKRKTDRDVRELGEFYRYFFL